MNRFWRWLGTGIVAVITCARDRGLLEAVRDRPATADEYADELGLDRRATRLVLDVLCGLSIVERAEDRYVWLGALGNISTPWSHLDEFLRTGETSPFIDRPDQRGRYYEEVVSALAEQFEPSARILADAMGPARRILDVGAGSGIWSLVLAARSPHTRVVGLDLAAVVPRFLAHARAMRLDDRVEGLAGDYHEVVPEGTFDRVLLANVLHLEGPADARALIQRFAGLLDPGGELIIVDCFGSGMKEREIGHAIYALHLGLRTAIGSPHSDVALREWCERAGLCDPRVIYFDAFVPGLGALTMIRRR